jgi:hypothetical protein
MTGIRILDPHRLAIPLSPRLYGPEEKWQECPRCESPGRGGEGPWKPGLSIPRAFAGSRRSQEWGVDVLRSERRTRT